MAKEILKAEPSLIKTVQGEHKEGYHPKGDGKESASL